MTAFQPLIGRYVAITMLDATAGSVMIVKDRLAQQGYEAVIFQSSGGPAMAELARADMLAGAIDFVACESFVIQNSPPLPRLVVPLFTGFGEHDQHTVEAAESIAHWLNDARSPVVVLVPTKGLKVQGRTFLTQFMKSLSAKVQLITIEADVTSPRFANRAADEFLRMVGGRAPVQREGSSLA